MLDGVTWSGRAGAIVGVPQTFVGHTYGATVTNPNEDKPQSKLWFHDGSWWALMAEAGGTRIRIHELAAVTSFASSESANGEPLEPRTGTACPSGTVAEPARTSEAVGATG